MPPARKQYFHNTVLSVASRMEEGLPLLPLDFVNELIWSCLAVACERHPVEIIACTFEANHFHLVFRVINPEDVSRFLGYLKQELSHRINRLLGKRKKTNWCKGFSSPTVLDYGKVLQEIAYALTNPIDDCLVHKLDEYRGVSTWQMFKSRRFSKECRYTSRDSIPCLKNPERPWLENRYVWKRIKKKNRKKLELTIHPYAWTECFAETREMSDEEAHELMMEEIRRKELELQQAHEKDKVRIAGFNALCVQSMVQKYIPQKHAPRMICLSLIKELRQRFIEEFKATCALARQVYENWKRGDYSIPFPPGLFAPPPPRLANALPPAL